MWELGGKPMPYEWGMNLVMDVELHMAHECSKKWKRTGRYVCNCEDPFQWSLEKLLDYAEEHVCFVDYSELRKLNQP